MYFNCIQNKCDLSKSKFSLLVIFSLKILLFLGILEKKCPLGYKLINDCRGTVGDEIIITFAKFCLNFRAFSHWNHFNLP